LTTPILLSPASLYADFQVRLGRPAWNGEMLPVDHLTRRSGGETAERAFVVRRLGHPAQLRGRVGGGGLSEQALGTSRGTGVDLAALSTADGPLTAFFVSDVPSTGKKAILLARHAKDTQDDPASHSSETDWSSQPACSNCKRIKILLPRLAGGMDDLPA